MAKYDAFGREVGEDTLADAGWRTPGAGTPPVEAATGSAPVSRAPVPRPRRSGLPKAIVPAVLFAFVVVGVGLFLAVGALVDSFEDSVGDLGVPDADTIFAEPPGQVARPEEPGKGLEPSSFLLPDRLAPALSRLRHAGGRILMLRIAPERIDAQLDHGRTTLIVQIAGDGEMREIARTPLSGGVPPVDLRDVDAHAPQRLLRSASERFGLEPDDVDYLVLLRLGEEPTWNAFYRSGAAHVQARLDGRVTRRAS